MRLGNRLFHSIVFAGLATTASAVQLVLYPIPTGSPGNVQPNPVAANMTASNLSVGAGSAAVSTSSRTGFLFADDDATTEAGAVANNDYWEFTIDAAPGFVLDLDEITFPFGGTSQTGGFDTNFFVRTDVDNFTSTIGSDSVNVPNGTVLNGSNFSTAMLDTLSITLSGNPSFQNLDDITFRIYAYTTANGSSQITRLSQIEVSGDVANIPEPSTMATLLGLSGLALPFLRPRNRV